MRAIKLFWCGLRKELRFAENIDLNNEKKKGGGYHEKDVTKSTGRDTNEKLPGQNLLKIESLGYEMI